MTYLLHTSGSIISNDSNHPEATGTENRNKIGDSLGSYVTRDGVADC